MALNVATKVREDVIKKRREITGARVAAWLFGGWPDCAIIKCNNNNRVQVTINYYV